MKPIQTKTATKTAEEINKRAVPITVKPKRIRKIYLEWMGDWMDTLSIQANH